MCNSNFHITITGFVVKKEQVRQMLRDIGRDPGSQITFEDFTKIMAGKMGDRNSREEINKVRAPVNHLFVF